MTMVAERGSRARAVPRGMRAVLLTALGGPEHLEIGSLPTPRPGEGEVLRAVRTVAANRTDTFTMRGHATTPTPLPHVLGLDPAGIVAELGSGVTALEIGRSRVSIAGHSGSTLAAFREAFALAAEGRLRPNINIHAVLPLERVRDAFETLLARGNRGKIILEVSRG